MTAIIAGGRHFIGNEKHELWLKEIFNENKIDYVISGGDTGADEFGKNFAIKNRINGIIYSAEWDKYGKKAGPTRNERMAKDADICILFPGGRGTADMKRRAALHGLDVYEYTGIE